MLSNHLTSRPPDQLDTASASYMTGTCIYVSSNSLLPPSGYWIIDSGASKHMCSNAHAFKTLKPIQRATVTLPNHTSISVTFAGDVHISPQLTLTDVLYVPQFKFNLISVSALTKNYILSWSLSYLGQQEFEGDWQG